MPRIFICYRREDAGGHAGRLYDRLAEHFGEASVFRDIDTLAPGTEFPTAVEKDVRSADVLLAVIGRDWVNATDPTGARRLDDPGDYVRLELAIALRSNVHIIPILVRGGTMPPAGSLPAELKPLVRRNALEAPDPQWRWAVAALIESLEKEFPSAEPQRMTAGDETKGGAQGGGFSELWTLARESLRIDQMEIEQVAVLRTFLEQFGEGTDQEPGERIVSFAYESATPLAYQAPTRARYVVVLTTHRVILLAPSPDASMTFKISHIVGMKTRLTLMETGLTLIVNAPNFDFTEIHLYNVWPRFRPAEFIGHLGFD